MGVGTYRQERKMGVEGGAKYIIDTLNNVERKNKPVYITNWAYLGGVVADDQLVALKATDEFFSADSPIERVYWFGAQDYGGGTVDTTNYLTEATTDGSTLGDLWNLKCVDIMAKITN